MKIPLACQLINKEKRKYVDKQRRISYVYMEEIKVIKNVFIFIFCISGYIVVNTSTKYKLDCQRTC